MTHAIENITKFCKLASLAPTYLTTDIHLVSEFSRRPLRSSTDTNSSTNPQQIWWQRLCCCTASFVEQFAEKSAADL